MSPHVLSRISDFFFSIIIISRYNFQVFFIALNNNFSLNTIPPPRIPNPNVPSR